jgi:hypothetical protein
MKTAFLLEIPALMNREVLAKSKVIVRGEHAARRRLSKEAKLARPHQATSTPTRRRMSGTGQAKRPLMRRG